ncbi:MAG TPA: phage major capsid protein [Stellaceae bacterium]|nr:phage major capsid protein [Stellaceae bacterium]
MDPRPKLHQLKQQRAAAYDELQKLQSHPDQRKFDAKASEVESLDIAIARAEKTLELARTDAKLTPGGELVPNDGWKNAGEQFQAVMRAAFNDGRGVDPRLIRAPAGLGETDPSGGGFTIAPEFSATILTRAYDMGELAKRVFKLPIEGPGIRIPSIDEQSRVTGSRWGGVQSYWVGEGDTVTATKPKFRLIELYLKKLMSLWYVTDEMLADSTALTGIANQAFAEEIMFMIEDAIFEGSGAGQPQGYMNANALVTVPADKGQAPKTLTYTNVTNMWQHAWARARKNMVWLINQDCESQLLSLSTVVGTGGQPVYLPVGSIGSQAANAPNGTLLGRPVIPIEYANTLGTTGDITLVDLSQFVVADRNAMQQMSSIHVRFTTDEMTFRLTYRVDGSPIWHTGLTPFKGSNTLSPFIALASR